MFEFSGPGSIVLVKKTFHHQGLLPLGFRGSEHHVKYLFQVPTAHHTLDVEASIEVRICHHLTGTTSPVPLAPIPN